MELERIAKSLGADLDAKKTVKFSLRQLGRIAYALSRGDDDDRAFGRQISTFVAREISEQKKRADAEAVDNIFGGDFGNVFGNIFRGK